MIFFFKLVSNFKKVFVSVYFHCLGFQKIVNPPLLPSSSTKIQVVLKKGQVIKWQS